MRKIPKGARPLPIWGEGGGKIVDWCLVDEKDWKELKRYKWWLCDGYAFRTVYVDGKKTTVSMHREIMELEKDDPLEVDHVNLDRLDNRRSNLRVVTRYENEGNHDWDAFNATSKKIGVSFDSRLQKWKAQAMLDGKYVYLGSYTTENAAILARMQWEEKNGRIRPDERERLADN